MDAEPFVHNLAAPAPFVCYPTSFNLLYKPENVLTTHKNPWISPYSEEPYRTSSERGKTLVKKAMTWQTALCMLHFPRSNQSSEANKKM